MKKTRKKSKAKSSAKSASGRAGRPRATDSVETRARILETALALFNEKGYGTATMRQIASAANISVGTVYHHFGSKEDLVFEFYSRNQAEAEDAAVDIFLSTDRFDKRLTGILTWFIERFTPYRESMGAIMQTAVEPGHPLSPFSSETVATRNHAIRIYRRSLRGSNIKLPADLEDYVPVLLWLSHLGLLMFWVHDNSPEQKRTAFLINAAGRIIPLLIKLMSNPLLRPFRKELITLLDGIIDPSFVHAGKS